MEKNQGFAHIKIDSHSNWCCLSSGDDKNIIIAGDKKGRWLLFDVRWNKPIVKLITTSSNSDITAIVSHPTTNELFFSTGNEIYSCDNTFDYTHKVASIGNNKVHQVLENESEITDFTITSNSTIVFPNEVKDSFSFYDTNVNEYTQHFSWSNCIGVESISRTDLLALYSFDGEIVWYNYKDKIEKASKKVQNCISPSISDESGQVSNPPFWVKMIHTNTNSNEIVCGLMNGGIVGWSASNWKKKTWKPCIALILLILS